MTVAELRTRLSHQEWVEWSAYYALKSMREELEMNKAKSRGG